MMAIRKALPDTMSYTEKCRLLEELSDEYRRKSRREVQDEVNRFKNRKNA